MKENTIQLAYTLLCLTSLLAYTVITTQARQDSRMMCLDRWCELQMEELYSLDRDTLLTLRYRSIHDAKLLGQPQKSAMVVLLVTGLALTRA